MLLHNTVKVYVQAKLGSAKQFCRIHFRANPPYTIIKVKKLEIKLGIVEFPCFNMSRADKLLLPLGLRCECLLNECEQV